MIELIKFRCPNCHSEFYLYTVPGTVSCPSPECHCIWAPRTMDGAYERGEKITFLSKENL